jgi:hypothetical protein
LPWRFSSSKSHI